MTKTLSFLALAVALTGCAAPATDDDAENVQQGEDEFARGDVYKLRAPFLREDVDNRPPPADRGDIRCWRANPPKTLKCTNPPMPRTNVGQGQLAIITKQARTEGQSLIFDVQVKHPSFDGSQTVTRTFRGVRFVSEGVTYNLSEWRPIGSLEAGGLTYDVRFTFANDGFIRDVFEERVTRAEVFIGAKKQFMTMSKDTR